MSARLPVEFELAVLCCAPAAPDQREHAVRIAGRVDWERFLATCRRHRVQGLAWRAIQSFDLAPPPVIAAQLEADAVRIAADGLRSAGISAQMLAECQRAGIEALFVKGLTLSRLAFGDPFVKMSHDIDVLVRRRDIKRAGVVLAALGYIQTVPRDRSLADWHHVHKESVWTRDGAPTVDLHSRLADHPRLIPAIGLDSPVQSVAVTPAIVLPTLAGDELIAYLAVHGAWSAWFRLKWIADLAALLADRDAAAIDRLRRRAVSLGAGRAIDIALLMTNRLFGVALGPEATRAVDRPACRLLAIAAFGQLLADREPTERRLGTVSIHASHLLLMPGARFAAGEVARQARATLTRG